MTLTGNTIFTKLDQAYPDSIKSEATGEIVSFHNDSTVVLKIGLFNRNSVIDFTDISSLTFEMAKASDAATPVITKTDSSLSTSVTKDDFNSFTDSHATITLSTSDLVSSTIPYGTYYVNIYLTTSSGTQITMGAGRMIVIDKDTGVTDSSQLATIISSGSGDLIGPSAATDNAVVRFNGTTGKLVQDSDLILDDSGNLTVTGTVDGRDLATDGTKLDTIETSADVTDETNVLSSLSGATISSVTPAGADKVLLQDTSDSDNIKYSTVTDIVNMAGGGNVTSVNGETGVVVLDADDIDDSATSHKFVSAAEISKLSGIETSADVTDTANVEAALPTTTKGDLMIDDGTNIQRLAIGTNDQILTADSAESLGVKWADASAGGGGMYTLLSTTTISGSPSAVDVDVSNTSYTKFKIVFDKLKPTTNGQNLILNFSFDGSTYAENMRLAGYRHYYGGSGFETHGASSYILGFTAQAGADSAGLVGEMDLFQSSTTTPAIFLRTFNHLNGTSFYDHRTMAGTIFDTVMPTGYLDSFRITSASGTMLSGTIKVYGL